MESTATLTVRRVPLDSLVPDPANPRVHDEANLGAIRASLARFGQAEPVVVQSGTRRIIAGHGRLSAMKSLGWRDVDVVELPVDDLTATALGVALNRAGELATWDDHALAPILKALEQQGALDGVGFSSADVDELLKQLEAEAAAGTVADTGAETGDARDPVEVQPPRLILGGGDSSSPRQFNPEELVAKQRGRHGAKADTRRKRPMRRPPSAGPGPALGITGRHIQLPRLTLLTSPRTAPRGYLGGSAFGRGYNPAADECASRGEEDHQPRSMTRHDVLHHRIGCASHVRERGRWDRKWPLPPSFGGVRPARLTGSRVHRRIRPTVLAPTTRSWTHASVSRSCWMARLPVTVERTKRVPAPHMAHIGQSHTSRSISPVAAQCKQTRDQPHMMALQPAVFSLVWLTLAEAKREP